jgi:hypothetical protein
MKKSSLFLLLLAALYSLCPAQSQAQTFDLMTNPQDWANGTGSACLQWQPFGKWSLCGSVQYAGGIRNGEDFQRRFHAVGISTEARYFPFGVRKILSSRKLAPWQHVALAKRKSCPTLDPKASPVLQGLYIAPGYAYQKTNLEYLPNAGLEAPIEGFHYTIKRHAGTLYLGYQIRIVNLTLDAGYGVAVSQPKWEGPADIFGESLYTHTYPLKFRLDKGFRFGVGVNF